MFAQVVRLFLCFWGSLWLLIIQKNPTQYPRRPAGHEKNPKVFLFFFFFCGLNLNDLNALGKKRGLFR